MANDQRVGGESDRAAIGGPTAPITARSIISNDTLRVTAGTVASNTAWSQTYEVETVFGISQAVASGTVQAAPTTASIVAQWEPNDGFVTDDIGNLDGTYQGSVAFNQPTIPATPTGTTGHGVAMNGNGHIEIPDPGRSGSPSIFQQRAFGISFYAQVGSLATIGTPSQLVHKDTAVQAGGLAIEYVNVSGINRLDPYMRDASSTIRRFAAPSPATARDLGLNQSFLVTFTYEPTPATGGKCKLYLRRRLEGGNTLVGDEVANESQITGVRRTSLTGCSGPTPRPSGV